MESRIKLQMQLVIRLRSFITRMENTANKLLDLHRRPGTKKITLIVENVKTMKMHKDAKAISLIALVYSAIVGTVIYTNINDIKECKQKVCPASYKSELGENMSCYCVKVKK